MSNVIWSYDQSSNITSSYAGFGYVLNGTAAPFTGNLNMEWDELSGQQCLRIFGHGNQTKGCHFILNIPNLPLRYQIEWTILSTSATTLNASEFHLTIAPFANYSLGHVFAANGVSWIYSNHTESYQTAFQFGGYNNNDWLCGGRSFIYRVDYRPSAIYPSGAFALAGASYGQDHGGALMASSNVNYKSRPILTSSWAGAEMNQIGIGIGPYYNYQGTGSIWITNFRVLKHPLDLEFDSF